MDRERVSEALERIERAFARIEAAADCTAGSADSSLLVQENRFLRQTVDAALGEIDELIERLDG